MADQGKHGGRGVHARVDESASIRNGGRRTADDRLRPVSSLTAAAIWLAAAVSGCGGTRTARPLQPPATTPNPQEAGPNGVSVEVLTNDDLTRKMPEVPAAEARHVVAVSFPEAAKGCAGGRTEAWVKSSIRGSFTGPGLDQTMYSVQLTDCDSLPSDPHRNFLVVVQAGREVWRTLAPEAVRAVEVDGDGQDEWLELSRPNGGQCGGACVTEAWVERYRHGESAAVAHVEKAEESGCMAPELEDRKRKRILVTIERRGTHLRVVPSEHVEQCK